MRFIFLIFLTLNFPLVLNADYLYIVNNRCVKDITHVTSTEQTCFTYLDNGSTGCTTNNNVMTYLFDGYDFDGTNCVLQNDLQITSLSKEEWDNALAIIAHFSGFTMLFLIGFMSVLIARK